MSLTTLNSIWLQLFVKIRSERRARHSAKTVQHRCHLLDL